MVSLDGDCNGNFHFLVYLCMLSFLLLLLKERTYITSIIRIKLHPLGVGSGDARQKTMSILLLGIHSKNKKNKKNTTDFLPSARTCIHTNTYIIK